MAGGAEGDAAGGATGGAGGGAGGGVGGGAGDGAAGSNVGGSGAAGTASGGEQGEARVVRDKVAAIGGRAVGMLGCCLLRHGRLVAPRAPPGATAG